MRITKEAEERRNEILDAAGELFQQKGYDKTSTNEILEKVGIARGTLYYHFKSKEEIMDALIERSIKEVLTSARMIAENKSTPVMERIFYLIMAIRIEDGENNHMIEELHTPQNALMHQKMNKEIIKGITPIFTSVVKDGIEEGLFETPYVYECMEMTITYASVVFDNEVIDMTEQERNYKMQALFYNTERLLNAEYGSMSKVMESMKGKSGSEEGK